MLTSFTLWWIVSVVLMAYLCVSVALRRRALLRAERARLLAIDKEFPPRAFDPSTIAPRIRRVRQDYAAAARPGWRSARCRSELVAAARQLVTRLAYLRRMGRGHELRQTAASTSAE